VLGPPPRACGLPTTLVSSSRAPPGTTLACHDAAHLPALQLSQGTAKRVLLSERSQESRSHRGRLIGIIVACYDEEAPCETRANAEGTGLQRRAPAVALLLRLEHQAHRRSARRHDLLLPEHGAMRRRSHAIALRDGGRPRDDFPVHTGDDGLLRVDRIVPRRYETARDFACNPHSLQTHPVCSRQRVMG